MNIIIDVNHPGHVHLFKNFAFIAQEKGWKVLFTAKDKEVTIDLLKAYKLNYRNLGSHYTGKLGKIYSLLKHVIRLFFVSIRFKPSYYLSHGSVPASWVSFLLRKKYIAFEDTGNLEQIKLYKPFAHAILTAESFKQDYAEKQVRYSGYHELAYLHPNYFIADHQIYDYLNIKECEPYFILRFVSWGASHDFGQSGISDKMKREIIKLLINYGKVFISSETDLPDDLIKYKIKIPPERMHDVLAFAHLYIGEGATMASECAILGTPAIYVNSLVPFYIIEQQDYKLLYHFSNSVGVVDKLKELLSLENIGNLWQEKRQKLLNDKIDVTAFTMWFVENFPESMKKNYKP